METRVLRLADLSACPLGPPPVHLEVVLAMTRASLTLSLLDAWSKNGAKIFNDPSSIRNILNRPALFAALRTANIDIPSTGWMRTGSAPPIGWLRKNAWTSHNGVKGTGEASHHRERTRRSQSRSDNGWNLWQANVGAGYTVKLYSVGGDLMVPASVTLDAAELRDANRLIGRCRDVLGADVFGIDVIFTEDGAVVVDVNDFPSFAGVASPAETIVEFVLSSVADVATRSA